MASGPRAVPPAYDTVASRGTGNTWNRQDSGSATGNSGKESVRGFVGHGNILFKYLRVRLLDTLNGL